MSLKKRGKAASWFLKKRKKAFKEFLENRGQAAMEFLLNYGWVIIVVLVVLAALSYFGILSPSSLMPEKCVVATGVSCVDYVVGDDGIQLSLQNSAGKDMVISRIDFVSDALVGDCSTGQIVGLLEDGATKSFAAADPAACAFVDTDKAKNTYDIRIEYSWSESPSITHTFDGELFSGVEADAVIGGGDYTGSGELSGYWAFDVANQTEDSSGNGNDGTVNGATWQGTGCMSGGCYVFGGDGDYISVPDDDTLDFGVGSFTISVWLKVPGDQGTYNGAIVNHGSYNLGYTAFFSNGRIRLEGGDAANAFDMYNMAPDYEDNVWHHFVWLYDGGEFRTYSDGNYYARANWAYGTGNPSAALQIGKWWGEREPFTGTLDEVMIYDRALSYPEIQALYNI